MVEKEKDILAQLREAGNRYCPEEGCLCEWEDVLEQASDEIEALRSKLEACRYAFSEYMSASTDEIERLRERVDTLEL